MKTEKCYCGGIARPIKEERPIRIGKRSVTVLDEFMRCETCEEEYYLPGQMDATQRRAVASLTDLPEGVP